MLRDLRRGWRRWRAARAIEPRQRALLAELSRQLHGEVTLRAAGARGRDSIFVVAVDGRESAMLRLLNPALKRKPVAAHMPYRTLPGGQRIDHEYRVYASCWAAGLTPRPLWRSSDALLCERLPGERLSAQLARRPECLWRVILRAAEALQSLHAHGFSHMDASLANTIDRGTDGCALIDFEYAAAAGLSVAQQRLYDHLRLLESAIKSLDPALLEAWRPWVAMLARQGVRDADVRPLLAALPRLLASRPLRPALQALLPGQRLPGPRT